MADREALIVEDELATGEILKEMLRRQHFKATLHTHGAEAVQWVREHKPDLVVLDLMLPDKHGLDICREIKLDRETNLTPVIIASALDRHEDMVRGLEVGADFYLTKPFTLEQLEEAIREAMAWRDEMRKSGTNGEIEFQFRSDLQYLKQLSHLLSSLLLFTPLTTEQAEHLTMAIHEMGANAIEWGHRKQVDRVVTLTYRIDNEKVEIIIRDTGPGFDPKELTHAAKAEDPTAHMEVRDEKGLRVGGFGIMLARGLVDELKYNSTGNEVRLVKRFPQPA